MSEKNFLSANGWGGAHYESFPADWGTRRYARLTKSGGETALLMDMGDKNVLPDYMRIADYLRSIGLSTPEIYAKDEAAGLALISDFGSVSFGDVMQQDGGQRADYYTLATDVLIHLRDYLDLHALDLPDYRATPYHIGKRRIVDWYLPVMRVQKNSDGAAEEFIAVWDEIEADLSPCPQIVCHADYHPENLLWRPDEKGLARCGIIDFQEAFIGPEPYDLVNLLEDIRNDIPEDIRVAMKDRYCVGMSAEERAVFESWYRVSATIFHCRVIGQCYKMVVERGRDDLLRFVPRMEHYLHESLKVPVLAPLKKYFDEQGMDFENPPVIMTSDFKPFIREDAY